MNGSESQTPGSIVARDSVTSASAPIPTAEEDGIRVGSDRARASARSRTRTSEPERDAELLERDRLGR